MKGLDVHNVLDAFQNVGQVTQHIFGGLGGGIGSGGEKAEGSHIGEIPQSAEIAHVQGTGRALQGGPGGLHHVPGEVHGGGEIIGAAQGNIAQGDVFPGFDQPGDDFVQRAVAADADHAFVLLFFSAAGQFSGVAALLRQFQIEIQASGTVNFHDVHQSAPGPQFAGHGIYNQQYRSHCDLLWRGWAEKPPIRIFLSRLL